MKYAIYNMVSPEHLATHEVRDYCHKKIDRIILEEISEYFGEIQSRHDSMGSAISEINNHKSKLKNKTITILPIIEVDYEGEIRL